MPVITKTRVLTDTTLDNLADVVFGGLYVPEDANQDRPFIPFLDEPGIAELLHRWGRQPAPAGGPTTLYVGVLDENGLPLRHKDDHDVYHDVERPGDVKGVTYSLVSRRLRENYLRVGINHYFDVCDPETPSMTWCVSGEETIVIDCYAPWTNRVTTKLTCNQEWARPCFDKIDHELEKRWPNSVDRGRWPGGRPKNSGVLANLTPAAFHTAYWTLQAEHKGCDTDKKVSQAELGTRLIEGETVSSQTVRRYLKRHGLRWPPDHNCARWIKNSG